MKHQIPHRRVDGFTLIELLVVISIIALLVSILLPALGAARDAAQSAVCKSNLKQNGVSIYLYANDYDGYLPMSGWSWYNGTMWGSWRTLIDPYTQDRNAGHGQYDNNDASQYQCPELLDNGVKALLGSYIANGEIMKDGGWGPGPGTFVRIESIRRPSNTFMLTDGNMGSGDTSEKVAGGVDLPAGYRTTPQALLPDDPNDFDARSDTDKPTAGAIRFRHPENVANAVFADGHVASLIKGQVTASIFLPNE